MSIPLLIVAVVVCVVAIIQRERSRARVRVLEHDLQLRNTYLDYVFRQFSLHVHDPYMVRPGIAELRCFHCFYPPEYGHAPDCAWIMVRPLTAVLYPPKPGLKPTT